MILFLWNLVLAILWSALSNELSLSNLFVGFLIGFFVLFGARSGFGNTRYFGKVVLGISFAGFFLFELIKSASRIVLDILTLEHRMQPGVVAIPLDAKTDPEITLLANLISLTPGTLSLDVSEDRKTLYIHALYIDNRDVERFRREIKNGMERRVLELLR